MGGREEGSEGGREGGWEGVREEGREGRRRYPVDCMTAWLC